MEEHGCHRKDSCKIRFFKNFSNICLENQYSLKGKAIPLQTWTGPNVSRRLRLPDFKTICT
jgi:hypothetical protein